MAKYCELTKDKLRISKYNNGRIAISAIDSDGIPLCKCTVNLPDIQIPDDFVLIKNYSENEGVLEDLIEMDVISEAITTIPSGFIEVHLCEFKGL